MKEKWCTRHLTNSLSNQPDDNDVDVVDVAAPACCLWGLAAGDLVYGLCCPLPVKLQTPQDDYRGLAAGDLVYGLCCPLPVKLQTPQYYSATMSTMRMLMKTMIILVGEGKWCTRHLTNSLSTQPDEDAVPTRSHTLAATR